MKCGKISFVIGEDWEGMYLNGKLQKQGQQLLMGDLLDMLEIETEYFDWDNPDDYSQLPDNLEDCKLKNSL